MDARDLVLGTRRSATFATPEQKARWIDAAASEDATDPHLRAFAHRFAYASGRLLPPGDIVRRIHRYVRDGIAYRHDLGRREELADTATVLRRRWDDCDGKSRAFVALVRALGIPEVQARIRPVFRGRAFVHVQAEARWPGSMGERSDAQGWQLAETIVDGVGLGDDPDVVGRRDAAGHLRMAGPEVPRG